MQFLVQSFRRPFSPLQWPAQYFQWQPFNLKYFGFRTYRFGLTTRISWPVEAVPGMFESSEDVLLLVKDISTPEKITRLQVILVFLILTQVQVVSTHKRNSNCVKSFSMSKKVESTHSSMIPQLCCYWVGVWRCFPLTKIWYNESEQGRKTSSNTRRQLRKRRNINSMDAVLVSMEIEMSTHIYNEVPKISHSFSTICSLSYLRHSWSFFSWKMNLPD